MAKSSYFKGVILMINSAMFFSILQALGKQVGFLNAFERTFYLAFVACIILAFFIRKQAFKVTKQEFFYLNMRALLGFVSTIFVFLASVPQFPLTNLTLLVSTSTIFALVFAVLWLKEKMNISQWLMVAISFVGIVLVVQPTSLTFNAYSLYALAGGMFAGMAYVVIRKLRDFASPLLITFYFCLFCLVVSFPFACYYGFTGLKGIDYLVVLGMGVAMSVAQLSISYAYRFCEASKISIYMYSQNIFSLIIGISIFHEFPNFVTILGGACIIGAALLNYVLINIKR